VAAIDAKSEPLKQFRFEKTEKDPLTHEKVT
jgi:hypothetical protein